MTSLGADGRALVTATDAYAAALDTEAPTRIMRSQQYHAACTFDAVRALIEDWRSWKDRAQTASAMLAAIAEIVPRVLRADPPPDALVRDVRRLVASHAQLRIALEALATTWEAKEPPRVLPTRLCAECAASTLRAILRRAECPDAP